MNGKKNYINIRLFNINVERKATMEYYFLKTEGKNIWLKNFISSQAVLQVAGL